MKRTSTTLAICAVLLLPGVAAAQTAPTASLAAPIPDVVGPGGAAFEFDVVFEESDAGDNVDRSDLGSSDIDIDGPDGVELSISFVRADSSSDQPTIVATYRATPPGGSWSRGESGLYRVNMQRRQVSDSTNRFVAAGELGSFTVSIGENDPTATVVSALPDVTGPGVTALSLEIRYDELLDAGDLIDESSLSGADIRCEGPDGQAASISFGGNAPGVDAQSITATYEIIAPGGSWSSGEGGTWRVLMNHNGVRDISGRAVPVQELDSFEVVMGESAPTATVTAAPTDVTGPGDTSVEITVRYDAAPDVGDLIDESSISGADLITEGPDGLTLSMTLVSNSPGVDAASISATYRVIPSGGSWSTREGGLYRILLERNGIRDLSGRSPPPAQLGTFNVNLGETSPSAVLTGAPADVNGPGGGALEFEVTYTENSDPGDGIDVSSISGADIVVEGPDGDTLSVSLVSRTPSIDAPVVVTVYRVTPLGGDWSTGETGRYALLMQHNGVRDLSGRSVPAVALGSFDVSFGENDPTASALAPIEDQLVGSSDEFDIVVRYEDIDPDDGITASSISGADVDIIGPTTTLSPFSTSVAGSGAQVDVTYSFRPPGGSWGDNEAGLYVVEVLENGIRDLSDRGVRNTILGTFEVGAPANTAPTATLLTALSDLEGPAVPSTLLVEVRYDDADAGDSVDESDLGSSDISFMGPDGRRLTTSLVSNSPGSDAPSITATYRLSHDWASGDGGHWDIVMEPRAVSDLNGGQVPVQVLGGFEVIMGERDPQATLVGSLADVNGPGGGAFELSVRYDELDDFDAIDESTLTSTDLSIQGPGGTLSMQLVSTTPNVDAQSILAVYRATPPGGTWDHDDVGRYTLRLSGVVLDLSGRRAPADVLGGFDVSMGRSDPVATLVTPLQDVAGPGGGAFEFDVRYSDPDAGDLIDESTISSTDVSISGPGGVLSMLLVRNTPGVDAASITTTYRATPPGGTWGSGDGGAYLLRATGVVTDISGRQVSQQVLGGFQVTMGETDPQITLLAPVSVSAGPGNKSFDIDVRFTEADPGDLIDESTISTTDLRIFGPRTSFTPSSVSNTPNSDAVSIDATYVANRNFTSGDGGRWVIVTEGVVSDISGRRMPERVLGHFDATVGENDPVGVLAGPLPDLATGSGAFDVAVVYTDVDAGDAINVASIGTADVDIIEPDGSVLNPSSVSTSDPDGDGLAVTATYRFTPPGGSFDVSEHGRYRVLLLSNAVTDLSGRGVAERFLGEFEVGDVVDSDGDGHADPDDNCPGIANPDQLDTDGDLAGNACDDDDDGDGIEDGADNCPLDVNADQADADGDNIGDVCDPSPGGDSDGDGVPDSVECTLGPPCPDTDGDGVPDLLDDDDDGDSVPTAEECPGGVCGNTDGDPLPDYLDPDDDGDGVPTAEECPGGVCGNTDNDGVPDYLDADDDDDGVPTAEECPGGVCGNTDNDGVPDFRDPDDDGDGVPTAEECPGGVCGNTDNDGLPDYLDADDDDDGVPTAEECPGGVCGNTDNDGLPDYRDPDDDGDGVPTAEECPGGVCGNTDNDGIPDFRDPDDDGDGIPTAEECPVGVCRDTDGDGVLDFRDIDDDGDGVPTAEECPGGVCGNTDNDGLPDFRDPDDDGDGVPTAAECPGGVCGDTDGDTVPDYRDLDDDGDGVPTAEECPGGVCGDTDGDTVPDYRDPDDDGDGVPTAAECPGGVCGNTDNDGVPDFRDPDDDGDGVPTVAECPGGVCGDTDGDTVPDFRDPDDDGDGVPTASECPGGVCGNTDGDGVPDYLDPDDDGDGIPTAAECPSGICESSDNDGVPDYLDDDDDDDGVPTRVECGGAAGCGNADGDAEPDHLDLDSDGDGVPDSDECPAQPCRDTDGDGVNDIVDEDDDGDAVPSSVECPAGVCGNTDGDGLPDYLDTDSDGDGVPDADECPTQPCRDTDGDNAPDLVDEDDDDDGHSTAADNCPLDVNPDQADGDGDGIGDVCDPVTDAGTEPPLLTAPVSLAQSSVLLRVRYLLPEAPLAGSATLSFSQGGSTVATLQLVDTAADEAAGFDWDTRTDPALLDGVIAATVPALPAGTYDVTLSYQDALGNAPASATANDVVIDDALAVPVPMNGPAGRGALLLGLMVTGAAALRRRRRR